MSRCPCLLAVAVLWSIPACGDPAAVPEPASQIAAFTTISGPFAHDNLQIWLVHGTDAPGPARATLPLAPPRRRKPTLGGRPRAQAKPSTRAVRCATARGQPIKAEQKDPASALPAYNAP